MHSRGRSCPSHFIGRRQRSTHIPRKYRELLFQRVLDLIRADWETTYRLGAVPGTSTF